MFFNTTRYLLFSNVLSNFSSEWNNARYLVPSYFLTYSSSSSKIICKGLKPHGVLFPTS